jgi:putative Holliday junction resolvase
MRSLGLDVGDRRIGVAISGPHGLLAVPLTVIAKSEDAARENIIKLVKQHRIERIVIGLPRSLNGGLGQQANKVIAFTDKLSLRVQQSNIGQIDIELWDERFSTVAAERLMVEVGTKREKRNQRRDAIAASFILQGFLDSRHSEQKEGTV